MTDQEEKISNILVVDDDANSRRYIAQVLKRKNFQVDEASSGEEALKKISGSKYEIVISDLHMYQIGGMEVLTAAKNNDPHVQVLILTGFGSIPSAVKAMQRGAYEYLPKPIDQESFLLKVHNALERRQMAMLLEQQQKKIDEYHRMLERDLSLAKRVQDSLIPKNYANKDVSVAIEYTPMIGIGGDFVDIFDDRKGGFYITVIDITGHGITAALLVNRVCSEISKLVRVGLEPQQVLYHLNHFFCRSFAQTGMFLTIMSVKLDFIENKVIHSGSAHPAALLCSPQRKILKRLNSQNTIIGFESAGLGNFEQQSHSILPGDRIIVYTDGIVETENKFEVPFGLDGLKASLKKHIIKPVSTATRSIIRDVERFSYGELRDDILLVIAEIK
jgi:sigma-B regulation protein RsbU (phosphoserine phosphatase)